MNRRTKRRLVLSGTVVGSLSVLIAGGAVARNWYRAAQVAENRALGLEKFAAGQFKESLAPLSIASRGGEDLEVLLALAQARRAVPEQGLRHLKIALGMFSKAESMDPGNRTALDGQLECAILLGYVDQIESIAERILSIDQSAVRPREALLETRAAQGRWSDAMRVAEELEALQPEQIRWRAVHLQCLAASGADAEGRLQLVEKWLAEKPEQDGLLVLRADILRAMGRTAEAREIYAALSDRGVSDARLLAALLDGLESTGMSDRIERALAAASGRLADPSEVVEIEGERLLHAGRIAELRTKLSTTDRNDAAMQRLRIGAAYLAGDLAGVNRILEGFKSDGVDSRDFLVAAPIALGSGSRRSRIETIEQSVQSTTRDPLVAILVSDLLIEAGEFDAALSVLVDAFDQSGRRSQPVGLRAVRACATMGRVPDALAIARDLGLRYQSDGAVAAAILEAWSSALQAGFVPSRVFGALGSDSPEALLEYWTAMGRPRELGPIVAEVFSRRGSRERAATIIDEQLAAASDGEMILSLLPAVERARPDTVQAVLLRAAELPCRASTAIQLATRLNELGRREEARNLLSKSEAGASEADVLRLARARRAFDAPSDGSVAWIAEELKKDPSIDGASFVLSQPEVWSNEPAVAAVNAKLVGDAVGILRDALGANSQRVVVAEATMHLIFFPNDQARIAGSLAALADAERRTPDAVRVLTTLARLLEIDAQPDLRRAAALLSRAVQLQPGNAELYPDLVRVLQQTGDYAAASVAIDTYARLMGDNVAGVRATASMRETLGEFDEAAALRAQLSKTTNNAIDQLAFLRTKIRAGKFEEAEVELRTLAAQDDGALARRELALLLASSGRLEDARKLLTESAAVKNDPRIEELQAEIELSFGDLKRAEELARRARERAPSANADLLLARILARSQQLEEARTLLVAAIEASPDNPMVLPVAAAVLTGDLSESGRSSLRRALDGARASRPDLVAAVALLDGATTSRGEIRPEAEDLRDARDLTVRYSGSALVWRLASQFYAAAGQVEEAARLALMALSRLPNDESTAELAVLMSVEAGRIDDAAAAASAWQRMAGADLVASDSALALIEIIRRDPARSASYLEPHIGAIVANPSSLDALALFVTSNVLAGKAETLPAKLAALPQARRLSVTTPWLEAAQSLPTSATVEAIRVLADFIGPADAHGCVAVWTECCRQGESKACELAEQYLNRLSDRGVPKELLAADLAAAQRSDDAISRYESIFDPALGGRSVDLAALAVALQNDPAARGRFESSPVAIVAMNNLAGYLISREMDLKKAVDLARCVTALMPTSREAQDTLLRALLASGAIDDAQRAVEANPDPLYRVVGLAEAKLAAGDRSGVNSALAEFDSLIARRGFVSRVMMERAAKVRQEADQDQSGSGGAS